MALAINEGGVSSTNLMSNGKDNLVPLRWIGGACVSSCDAPELPLTKDGICLALAQVVSRLANPCSFLGRHQLVTR